MALQDFFPRRGQPSPFGYRVARRTVMGMVGGAVAAAATIVVDRGAGLFLPLPPSNSQVLLGTLVGAIVTITVFVLWMRTVLVGLASGQISARFLASYLDDRFPLNLTTWMMAALVYLTVVTAALPAHPEGGQAVPAHGSPTSAMPFSSWWMWPSTR